MKQDSILELEKNLVLVQIAGRGVSGDIIRDQTSRYRRKETKTVGGLENTKKIALEMKYALAGADLTRFGKLLGEAWEAKKEFSPLISTPEIDIIYETAKKSGALGGKVLGAGGGGHMLFYCKPNREHEVLESLTKAGAKPIPFTFDFNGLQTWEVRK